ncbi:SGNH/GDSL hydrolase family protein [Listeria booriae]|uniref:SGNH/GDSL hydrolase family protein n=1 Tax=Listeria booriae TaxID=1552123 RepID=UPI001625C4AD|nr:SGNH/GDSL hydrolase family protein [Listeria booriae]MBC1290639.1 BppU family phage baseplate upper protein [Listeria booriae]
MSDNVFKDLETPLDVSAHNIGSLDLRGTYSTQDIGTARMIFKLVNHDDLKLDLVEAYIFLSSETLKSEARAELDKENGQITYILSDEEIKHAGSVYAELYLRYIDGQALSVHKFHFKIERALIDQDLEIVDLVYSDTFKNVIEQHQKNFEEIEAEMYAQLAKYRNLQLELISRGFEKLRKGEQTKILAYGDSLTYGYDIYSADKRPADTKPTSNGTKHTRERASVTYPEALELALKQVYSNVSTQNCGYSGDTVTSSFAKWDGTNLGADITLFMLGHNDSKNAQESISDFISGYKKIIERALSWGSGVIFLTPPKQKNAVDFTVDVYSQAVIQLAKEYQAPVVDMAELTEGIPASFYSDSVHFNGRGYDFIGKKLAALFLNKTILNMSKVKAHDALNVVKETSGIQFNENCTMSVSEYFPTEDATETGKGVALVLKNGGKVYFSFYAEEANLLYLPSLYAGSKTLNLKVEMNFSAETANNAISYSFGTTSARIMNKPLKSVTYTTADLNWYSSAALFIDGRINASKLMYAPRRGYYTVSIENLDTYAVNLFGLEFRNAHAAIFGNNALYTLGSFAGDILTLAAGNYELYSDNAVNMPFAGKALATLEIYVGGSNRKLFRVTNLSTRISYEGTYNPTSSSQVFWRESITNIGFSALQEQIYMLQDKIEGLEGLK